MYHEHETRTPLQAPTRTRLNMDFLRSKKISSAQHLQAAYNEIYQSSLRAHAAESQGNYIVALNAWKQTKRIINQKLSTVLEGPHTSHESDLMRGIMEIDRQCYDRIKGLEPNVKLHKSNSVSTNDQNSFSTFDSSNVTDSETSSISNMGPPNKIQHKLKSDSSLASLKSGHKRSTSETERAAEGHSHSAPSIDRQRSLSLRASNTNGTPTFRTPSPQLTTTTTNPGTSRMLHSLRSVSGKSGMAKLMEERKAAGNAATLAWSSKQTGYNPQNAHNALAAASISTGNAVPPPPQARLTNSMEKLSVRASSDPRSNVNVRPKPQLATGSRTYARPVVRATPRPANSRTAQTTTKRSATAPAIPTKKTISKPAGKASKSPSPSGSESEESEAEEEEQWLKDARKKIKKVKGIDSHAAEQIFNDVVVKGDPVYWDDIAGLDQAKTSLKETVVYPFLRPDLFSGLREPAQGMLLFGPPGTGKTMLARAVAQESHSTFFSISASSLTSKFLGESEKLVKALFLMARALAPSIIFVDEIDSLLSARSDSGEHETSRRIKTEFLVQWSSLQHAAAGKDHEDVSRVLVLAATNLPWVIDEAARRRFVRRQYIPLPEPETRSHHIDKLLSRQKNALGPKDRAKLVKLTDGFSGSDLTALAKDAAMGPLRSLGEALLTTPRDQIRPITLDDFKASLKTIRPSVGKEGLKVFEDWAAMYGSSGA